MGLSLLVLPRGAAPAWEQISREIVAVVGTRRPSLEVAQDGAKYQNQRLTCPQSHTLSSDPRRMHEASPRRTARCLCYECVL
jgi:hypothetical protein